MTTWIELAGPQYERLEKAIVTLFDPISLDRLLQFRLGLTLGNIVAPGPMTEVVFNLIRTAQREGWLDDFLLCASEARPKHPVLEALKTELSLGKSVAAGESAALEAFVQGVGGLFDPAELRSKLALAEGAVCQISYRLPDGRPYGGTGFLVGPDVIMTNHHVMKYVIDGSVLHTNVTVKFDYKLNGDGVEVNSGNRCALAEEWLIDSSPHAATDLQALPTVPDTPPDQLDFALVRLDTPIGCQPIPSNVPGKADHGTVSVDPPRHWLTILDKPPSVAANAPLLILQHPQSGPMKLAWAPKSVLAVNGSHTRIRHATATKPGSSGSPCFDAHFNVVALHHAGDPAEAVYVPATYNQAIPMGAIVDLLNKRELGGKLRERCEG